MQLGDTAGAAEQRQETKFQAGRESEDPTPGQSDTMGAAHTSALKAVSAEGFLKPATLKGGTLKSWGSKKVPQNLWQNARGRPTLEILL